MTEWNHFDKNQDLNVRKGSRTAVLSPSSSHKSPEFLDVAQVHPLIGINSFTGPDSLSRTNYQSKQIPTINCALLNPIKIHDYVCMYTYSMIASFQHLFICLIMYSLLHPNLWWVCNSSISNLWANYYSFLNLNFGGHFEGILTITTIWCDQPAVNGRDERCPEA